MNNLSCTPSRAGFPSLFEGFGATRGFVPALDVVDGPEAIVVAVEVPGIDPKDVEVTLENNVLTVRGEKTVERADKEAKWYSFERATGSFVRRIRIATPVENDAIEAKAANGVLTIRLPKRAELRARRIAINAG